MTSPDGTPCFTGLISWTCLSVYWSVYQPVMKSESTVKLECPD